MSLVRELPVAVRDDEGLRGVARQGSQQPAGGEAGTEGAERASAGAQRGREPQSPHPVREDHC